MRLLPCPRQLTRRPGTLHLPARGVLHLPATLPRDTVLLPVAERLQSAAEASGVALELATGPARHPRRLIHAAEGGDSPRVAEGYSLMIDRREIAIRYRELGGLRAAVATLRQLLREHGRRLPCLRIRDYPDFPRRGVMLDVSRGRVPRLETLMELASHLADFKLNELQLYTEHTFAYRNYEPVWRDWGALTGEDILRLDAHCRRLGIDLVPNQNSFGHLRSWLEYPPLRKLAEMQRPWPDPGGAFLRYPSTLAPQHPGTLPFLRGLYDELLPHFTSERFNVGGDETWDLGLGQSKRVCAALGKGRVYLNFLKALHGEVARRGRTMMFWGDIILRHPELVEELPEKVIALNWGYEADHPFEKETEVFAAAKVPFYVCPGTSTWMTLIGRHDNAFANLRRAAAAGKRRGACGYLITDWGDGGHPQPLAVSYLPYLFGAAVSWCAKTFDEGQMRAVLSRDIFGDPSGRMAQAALALGVSHRAFDYREANVTPFGAVIAAPPPERRELVCRNGLKYYARIPATNVRAALAEVERQLRILTQARPVTGSAQTLRLELSLAARMARESCHYLLWQQALAADHTTAARQAARRGIAELKTLDAEFSGYWPTRNQGTPAQCSGFLGWRVEDYRRGKLHFSPAEAAG